MEKNNNFRFFAIFVALIAIIFSLYFVLAAAPAPTGLIINQNVTSVYDEGTFTVNWTSGGAGSDSYNIYVHSDNSGYTVATNDSETGYSFSNITEANYTFIIEAVNSTGNTNSTTNISITVDSDGPVITLPEYTNGTAKKNTAQLTLNISLADVADSNAAGSHCLIDVNGTANQTVVASGGWCNSSSINLTGTSEGNSILNIWANNSANVFNLSNTFVVLIDDTAPIITLTKTTSGQTSLEIAISGVDGTCTVDRSGATISGNTLTETSLSCSNSYTYIVTCTDSAGNAGSSSATSFSTTGCSSGDGGGTTTPPPKKIQSWSKITPGVVTIMKNFDPEIGIKEIQIEVNNNAQNVKITVTKYVGKPAAVSVVKSGKVFQYLQIDAQNLADKLSKATVMFRAGKSWLSSNGLGVEDVALFRFDDSAGQWNELPTTYTGSEGDDELYEVELTSFSFFAISEKSVTTGDGEEVDGVMPPGEEGKRSLAWLWILIAVVVLVGLGWRIRARR